MPDSCPLCETEVLPDSRFCHHCGAPLAGVRARVSGRSEVAAGRALVIVTYVLWGLAWAGSFVDPEAMTVVGFFNVVMGLVMIVLAVTARYLWAGVLGAAHCGLYAVLLVLVGVLGWSVDESRKPFLFIVFVYLAAALPLTIVAYWRAPVVWHPRECQKCGYLLYGLTEPRCPECGEPFDPVSSTKGADPRMEN